MILFNDIFRRAVDLFDDPDIRKKYFLDPVGFQKTMRPFLINGKNRFTEPTIVVDKLSIYSDAQGKSEQFEAESGVTTYALETHPVANSIFVYKINGAYAQGTYDSTNNSVTFITEIPTGATCEVIWYFAGAFTEDITADLNTVYNKQNTEEKIINILAHGILSAWSDQEMNRALEMRNILSDADMSFYSPANSTRSKIEWHKQVNRDMDTLIAELNWRIFASPRGSRFGK